MWPELCWPTPSELLLLTATTLKGRLAGEAWRQWLRHHSVNHADEGAYRLLPALHRNLEQHAPDAPQMQLLGGIARHTWFHNQRKFRVLATTLRALQDARTPVLLLKGAALCAARPDLLKARPMRDLDLLVLPPTAPRAVAALNSNGFVAAARAPLEQLIFRHATVFSLADQQVDLHTMALPESLLLDEPARQWAWSSASSIEVGGISVLVPGLTEQLFHCLVHGLRYSPVSPVRWVCDALQLLEAGATPGIDWARFVALCRAHSSTLLVGRALDYLVDHFAAPIPLPPRLDLRRVRPAVLERFDGFLKTRRLELVGDLPALLLNYARVASTKRTGERLRELPHHLRCVWDLPPEQSFAAALRERSSRGLKRALG